MSETITVCESICRDFSWIWFADPKVLQAGMTLFAAAVASCTALYIAQRVYPKQKEVDRKNEISKDRRLRYYEICAEFKALDSRLVSLGRDPRLGGTPWQSIEEVFREIGDVRREADALFLRLLLVGGAGVEVPGARVQSYFYEFPKQLKAKLRIDGEIADISRSDFELHLSSIVSETAEMWRSSLNDLVNAMRAEYGEPPIELSAPE
ncbi:hypothetical protein [Oceanicola sp. S124]|uniref:hypothetical protein n=1 Tax=Oceanicola sp. S124 TaxID=1042378 RepID=UPI000255A191|nr:hypothetical protein [Oceanicola sp. S124]